MGLWYLFTFLFCFLSKISSRREQFYNTRCNMVAKTEVITLKNQRLCQAFSQRKQVIEWAHEKWLADGRGSCGCQEWKPNLSRSHSFARLFWRRTWNRLEQPSSGSADGFSWACEQALNWSATQAARSTCFELAGGVSRSPRVLWLENKNQTSRRALARPPCSPTLVWE